MSNPGSEYVFERKGAAGRATTPRPEGLYSFDYKVHIQRHYSLKDAEDKPDGPEGYLTHIDGTIRYASKADLGSDETATVGEIVAHLVRGAAILNDHEPLFDVFDCHSSDLAEIHDALYRDGEATAAAEKIFKDGELDLYSVLVVQAIRIKPEHRGHGLGYMAFYDVIDTFADPSGAVACKPGPLGVEDPTSKAARAAKQALQEYWARMGFRRIGKTDIYGMSMVRQRPKLSEVMRKASAE